MSGKNHWVIVSAVIVSVVCSFLPFLVYMTDGGSGIDITMKLLFAALFSLVVFAGYLFFIYSTVTRGIRNVNRQMEELAGGDADLEFRLEKSTTREISRLADSVNRFLEKLRDIVLGVQRAVVNTDREVRHLNEASTDNAESVHRIHENAAAMSAALDSLDEKLNLNRESAQAIQYVSGELKQQMITEVSAVEETSAAAEQINAQADSIKNTAVNQTEEAEKLSLIVEQGRNEMGEFSRKIENLSQRTGQMMDAVNVISNIASQTNLLSMNAAIEAAHAGEQGKGFSVVAEEIRKLAENSAENSRLINQSLQESVNQVMEVSQSFAATAEAFTRVEETSRSVIQGFEHIRNTVGELTLGIREMTGAFISIRDSVSQINDYSGILDQSCADLEIHSEASVELNGDIRESMTQVEKGIGQIDSSVLNLSEGLQGIVGQIDSIRSQMAGFHVSEDA